jgi:predicted DCC family thiol-disulfide oxidoreductase YuxK
MVGSPERAQAVRVYYDGSCGLCHHTVRLLALRDSAARLRFAPLNGATFVQETRPDERAGLPDSLVVRAAPGQPLLVRSRAVALALRELRGGWGVLGRVLGWIPAPLADLGYRCVAALRRRLFAAPRGACPLLPPKVLARFDP